MGPDGKQDWSVFSLVRGVAQCYLSVDRRRPGAVTCVIIRNASNTDLIRGWASAGGAVRMRLGIGQAGRVVLAGAGPVQ